MDCISQKTVTSQTEKPIMAQLEDLFTRWEKAFVDNGEPTSSDGKPLFTRDGIMRLPGKSDAEMEEIWKTSERHIVFLLYEQYQHVEAEKRYAEDIREWFEIGVTKHKANPKEQLIPNTQFFQRIGALLYGLYHETHTRSINFEGIPKQNLEDIFHRIPCAFIECKKVPNGSKANINEIKRYIQKYNDLLKEEISILKPTVVVCMGRHTHDFMMEKYFGVEYGWTFSQPEIHYDAASGMIVLSSQHPSTRRKSRQTIYKELLTRVRKLLAAHPDALK
ncbi:MAG: uracil-DNA glycosylase family protein [Bacteroidales bacterium]|nr:uracil-DNA glycosylase family protein [Bacteroidales bacterium]